MDTTAREEISVVLERRKRLLTELFFLSKYIDVPQEYGANHGASSAIVDSEDLAAFLSENDLECGRPFNEKTLPEVRIEAVNIPELQAQQARNDATSAGHTSQLSLHAVVETSGTSGGGLIVEDNASTDAEIAKASLLQAGAQNDTFETPAGSQMTIAAQARPKLAYVEPVRIRAESDFDSLVWLIEARTNPLCALMEGANKTTDTASWSAALSEQKWIKTIERINLLKSTNRWSLRQPVKQKTAPRRKAHWDFLLDEMKWMRTDFREERKWKIVLASKIAYAVQEWHQSDDRETLMVRTSQRSQYRLREDVEMVDATVDYEPPTPPDGSDDMPPKATPTRMTDLSPWPAVVHNTMVHSPPLSAIDDSVNVFEMPTSEVYAYLSDCHSPSLIQDMPVYGPPVPADDLYSDALDSVPLITASMFTQSELRVQQGKKRKRILTNDDDAHVTIVPEYPNLPHARRKSTSATLTLRPPFVPSNMDRRDMDRKEHRIVWTPESDEMLLNLVPDFQYNWELVSQAMTPVGALVSVADRKSPWDCFERWIQLDPRSSDITFSGPQARQVQSRVDDMIRTPQSDRAFVRRSSQQVYKIHQHDLKKQRQFSVFDAMRKIQRKRENATKPTVVPKKPTITDVTKTPPTVPTPQHLSQMKFERDQQIARAFLESKNQQILAIQQQRQMQQKLGGQPPTQAQIAQIQAARQTQARAQIAQQAAAAAGVPGQSGLASPQIGARLNNGQPAGISRPSLVGQMPPRPISANGAVSSIPNGSPSVPNPALLRIPPGQRLSQEQMNLLLQQARLQKGLAVNPPINGAGTQTTPGGGQISTQQQQLQQPQQLQLQRKQAASPAVNGVNGANGKPSPAPATSPAIASLPPQTTPKPMIQKEQPSEKAR